MEARYHKHTKLIERLNYQPPVVLRRKSIETATINPLDKIQFLFDKEKIVKDSVYQSINQVTQSNTEIIKDVTLNLDEDIASFVPPKTSAESAFLFKSENEMLELVDFLINSNLTYSPNEKYWFKEPK